MHPILERVEKLEKQNRRMKQVGLASLIGAISVVLRGQAGPHNMIEAEHFFAGGASRQVGTGSWRPPRRVRGQLKCWSA